jgi:RNA polymerase sigma-70 factor (ECF subfamily)
VSIVQQAPELPEHYFRHEFGRLVSVLSRRFGVRHVEQCEDAAQAALLQALRSWPRSGIPADRGGWLYTVARNHLLDDLRRAKRAEAPTPLAADRAAAEQDTSYFEREVRDDQLRLLFVCADPDMARESQLVLAARVLCGFSIPEIALRLFQSHEAIHKRLQRARSLLRDKQVELVTPSAEQLQSRLPAVLHMLYLLFTEGYSSAQPDALIRRDLCEDAVRLALLVVEHPLGYVPETEALLALMYLHAARFEARSDGAGGLLLLEEQDRTLWDRQLIDLGFHYAQRSARGERFTRYHAEAAIAAEHCVAASFATTNWPEIVRLYELLERVSPSPLNTLNKAIALAEWQGPDVGLRLLETLKPPGWLLGYYLWDATLGELNRRIGERERAVAHLTRALASAPTNAERQLLQRRLAAATATVETGTLGNNLERER